MIFHRQKAQRRWNYYCDSLPTLIDMESCSFPKGNENLSFRDGPLTELSWSNYSWYESLGYLGWLHLPTVKLVTDTLESGAIGNLRDIPGDPEIIITKVPVFTGVCFNSTFSPKHRGFITEVHLLLPKAV